MFDRVTIRGAQGAIMLGYSEAATLQAWTISKHGAQWILAATIARGDAFQLRRRPLMFTAPRTGGYWAWGVEALDLAPADPPYTSLRARLGPPEH